MTNAFFCAEYSRQVGEQLFGTATRADVWLLLEYDAAWNGEAFRDSTLPDPVKAHVNRALAAIPKSRIELIKQRGTPSRARQFYVAVVREQTPVLYRFDLAAYEDLLGLDIPAIVTDGTAYQEHISRQPLFTVCTNGRRDRSCAKFGVPVYDALLRYGGESAWQCSHVGGHRFAGNVVFFPEGICYGWVDPVQVDTILDAYRQGHIVLEYYRGRSCYQEPVQAAEYYLRTETGVRAIDAYRFIDAREESKDHWTVRFASSDGAHHEVHVIEERSTFGIYKNSGDTEVAHVPQYRLAGVKQATS